MGIPFMTEKEEKKGITDDGIQREIKEIKPLDIDRRKIHERRRNK